MVVMIAVTVYGYVLGTINHNFMSYKAHEQVSPHN